MAAVATWADSISFVVEVLLRIAPIMIVTRAPVITARMMIVTSVSVSVKPWSFGPGTPRGRKSGVGAVIFIS